MFKQAKRSNQNSRTVKFTPSLIGAVARLEARALTAPAIWRYPTGYTGRNNDVSQSGVGIANDTEDTSSVATQTNDLNDYNGGGNTDLQLIGQATADVVEYDDPAPPASQVGNSAITINSTDQFLGVVTGTGNGGLQTQMVDETNVTRDYLLADTATGTGPAATLTETFSAHFAPPSTMGILAIRATLATPTLGVVANGSGGGWETLTLSFPNAGSSETITQSGSGTFYQYAYNSNFQQTVVGSISYSLGTDDFSVSTSNSVGVLPNILSSTGNLQGSPYNVNTTTLMAALANGNAGLSDVSSLTTNFHAAIA